MSRLSDPLLWNALFGFRGLLSVPPQKESSPPIMIVTFRAALVFSLAVLALLEGASAAAAEDGRKCRAPTALERLRAPLPRLSAKLAAKLPVTIVAFGSSSTEGVGASAPGRNYPSRLDAALREAFPNAPIRVLNKGIGGETEVEMTRRFERDVLWQHPDLVIWQVGANAVMRDAGVAADERLIDNGVRRLKQAGIDVVLMDLQYAPEMLRHRDAPGMERYIADVGRNEGVPVFRRFAIMRNWVETGAFDMARMISPDGVHMNDASYDCLARALARSLVHASDATAMAQQRAKSPNG
jgi:acyl-CoA thioesterase-1